MPESLTPERRSRLMARVKGTNTKPEVVLRSLLHRMGYRFRLHRKDLPGSPDIVLPKYRTAIFVHGCFWHRHPGCKRTTTPKNNYEFWQTKFAQNIERDARKHAQLLQLGWHVIIVWECETVPGKASELEVKFRKALCEGPHERCETDVPDLLDSRTFHR